MLLLSALLGAVIVLAFSVVVLRQGGRIRPNLLGGGTETATESPAAESGEAGAASESAADGGDGSAGKGQQPGADGDSGDDDDDGAGGASDQGDEGADDDADSQSAADAAEELGFELLECPDGTPVEFCEAAEFVQIARERPFKVFPPLELVEGDEFTATFLDDLEAERDEVFQSEVSLSALGLIPADYDLFNGYRTLIGTGALGVYFPETGEIKVRAGEFNLFAQSVLVHELTHAIDDQYFDLSRELDAEAEFGFTAVVEGNAERVEQQWRDQLSPADELELMRQEFASLSFDDTLRLGQLPTALLQFIQAPYNDGQLWVDDLFREGGEVAVDAALTDPPATSEQVLHPDLAAELAAVIDVPSPEAGGEIVDEGVLGELTLRVWLGPGVAAGWGGDRYVAWLDDQERACLAATIAADTALDLREMQTALNQWVNQANGLEGVDRSIEAVTVEVDGRAVDAVSVTGCA